MNEQNMDELRQRNVAPVPQPATEGRSTATVEQATIWDTVDEASDESFPCSDAPAWTKPPTQPGFSTL